VRLSNHLALDKHFSFSANLDPEIYLHPLVTIGSSDEGWSASNGLSWL